MTLGNEDDRMARFPYILSKISFLDKRDAVMLSRSFGDGQDTLIIPAADLVSLRT